MTNTMALLIFLSKNMGVSYKCKCSGECISSKLSLCVCVCFNSHFPGEPGLANVY